MRLLGFEFSRVTKQTGTQPVPSGGWTSLIRESFGGAWQRNVELRFDTALSHSAVFSCVGLISSDIAKIKPTLQQRAASGIWEDVETAAFSPVLRKPNQFQNRIQFYESWLQSKLINGNAYILKARDNRGVVVQLHVLDPTRVQVLVADDGSVFYNLSQDRLQQVGEQATVPQSEIIHDRWNTLFHPLVGTSPLYAAAMSAAQGLSIQNGQTKFFANGSNPGGILTAPGRIDDVTAARLREYWQQNYGPGGSNVGQVAVLGDGLKYEPMMMSATDAQLIEQLKWSAEVIASVFRVPAYMIGAAELPKYDNIEAMLLQYYSQGLQIHIESVELGLDEGLRLPAGMRTHFGLGDLLRMDTQTRMGVAERGVQRAIFAPDEARAMFDLPPVEGGAIPFLQEQNWPINLLANREAPGAATAQEEQPAPNDNALSADERSLRPHIIARCADERRLAA